MSVDQVIPFEEAARRIQVAPTFTALTAELDLTALEPGLAYKMLVKIVHPDVAPAGRTASATAAFARLSGLWTGSLTTPPGMRTLTTRRGNYQVGALVAAGDIADLYAAELSGAGLSAAGLNGVGSGGAGWGGAGSGRAGSGRAGFDGVAGGSALLKMPRMPADNDLLAAEARALSRLENDGDPKYRAYAPRLIESFTHEDPATGARRTANVLARQRGFVSLADVARAYPQGVDPRDAAWMWRRLLTGLGWAHRAGIVHGAVLPSHILIHPAEHGLVLVDWCYSVRAGESIAALVAAHRADYPPEVPAKQAAGPATDIYLATRTMRSLLKDRAPAALHRFADGCLQDAPRMRPQDAWKLLAELDELLENLYGPRRFREFAMPA